MGGNRPLRDPGSTELHPSIYWVIVGLCVWLVLSLWGFAGPGGTGLALTVASLFIVIAVAIPVLLWRIWHGHREPRQDADEPRRLVDWLSQDFEAWSGRQRGVEAAVEVLLPIAAVAFGMSGFALAMHFAIG